MIYSFHILYLNDLMGTSSIMHNNLSEQSHKFSVRYSLSTEKFHSEALARFATALR